VNALTTTRARDVAAMSESDLLQVMRDTLYPGARMESVQMVLSYCRARGLDPMKKPVHIVPMYVGGVMRDVPLPGITSYRIDAARTGEYDGKSEPEFGPDITREFSGVDRNGKAINKTVTFPAWCKVTVLRRGKPFVALEYWQENYATAGRGSEVPNEMWAKRPYGQLAKCAEAQALRMAFPEEIGGQNTAEEMEGKTFGSEQTVVGLAVPDQPALPAPHPMNNPNTMQSQGLRMLDDQLSQFGALDDIRGYLADAKVQKLAQRARDAGKEAEWHAIVQSHMSRVSPDDETTAPNEEIEA
jgi:phage recombination protein Bet